MSAINDGSGCFIIFPSRVDGEGSILEGWYMRISQAFVFFIYKKVALALIFMFVLCGVITDTTGQATDARTLRFGQTTLHARASSKPVRPVLAFYYMWYASHDWCLCHMSDLPTIRYNSNDIATIDRQLAWAASSGITGFISSWWGQG